MLNKGFASKTKDVTHLRNQSRNLPDSTKNYSTTLSSRLLVQSKNDNLKKKLNNVYITNFENELIQLKTETSQNIST